MAVMSKTWTHKTATAYMKKLWSFLPLVLISFPLLGNASKTVFQCLKQQDVELGKTAIVRCGDQNFSFVYWLNKTNEEDDTPFIQMENGNVVGSGYRSGEFDLLLNGSLVINKVKIQHESTYQVEFLGSDLIRRRYEITVTVHAIPNPPTILVEGCETFQPCHLIVRKGESINCTVNGVRPKIDLKFVDDKSHGVITNTDTESHMENELFYATIRGYVRANKATCRENITVMCQSIGPTAGGFNYSVYITATFVGDCFQTTDVMAPEQGDHPAIFVGIISGIIIAIVIQFIIGIIVLIVYVIYKRRSHEKGSYQMVTENSQGPLPVQV